MHLASISSQEENDRLEKHIRDYGENKKGFESGKFDGKNKRLCFNRKSKFAE